MILKISDAADESVGLFPVEYEIEAPLSEDDDPEDIEFFRQEAIKLYSQLACGRVTALYDFEVRRMEEQASEQAKRYNGTI